MTELKKLEVIANLNSCIERLENIKKITKEEVTVIGLDVTITNLKKSIKEIEKEA